jgi:endonuclease YncB( thermonuclease family)
MVDKSVLAALKSKAPSKPPAKAPEKTAAPAAPGSRGKPAAKPETTEAKGGKPAALPDAALLDDGADDGDQAQAPKRGLAAWLPAPGRKRWMVLGGSAGGLLGMIAAAAFAASHFRSPPPPAPDVTTIAGQANAMDGATLRVRGHTVHLEDIDAPPATLICRDGAWTYRCGEQARRALDSAIGSAPVECVNPHTDGEGRTTALCRNDTGLDLAAIQVESGWAVNDLRASSRYIAEESRAENGSSGLWRNDFAHPELWHDQASKTTPTERR